MTELYDALLEVFDFRSDAIGFQKKTVNLGWKKHTCDDERIKDKEIWINNNGEVIIGDGDELDYYSYWRNIDAAITYEQAERDRLQYIVPKDEFSNPSVKASEFISQYLQYFEPLYTKLEFEELSKKCKSNNFSFDEGLVSLICYDIGFLNANLSGKFELDFTRSSYAGFPFIKSTHYDDFDPASTIFKALDSGNSEFLHGIHPIDILCDLMK